MIPRLLVSEVLDLTTPGVVVGQHAAWWPAKGLKVPFQWSGRVQKYRKIQEASYPLESLAEEYAFACWLSERGMGPTVGRWIYCKAVISEHPGGWWEDPCGAYGWEVADARTLPPGRFSVAALHAANVVEGSPGAWHDLDKPGNVVHGYLVDTRRSWHDRLRWLGPIGEMPRYEESVECLRWDLQEQGAFPFRDRPDPYQEYYLSGRWQPAERSVVQRAGLFPLAPRAGESVVDLGCHTGGFLAYAWLRQRQEGEPGRLVGIESQPEYVALARRLARANGMNLCVRHVPLGGSDDDVLVAWLQALCPAGVDHLLALSLAKHLPGGEATLWRLVDAIGARETNLETHAVAEGVGSLHAGVQARGGRQVGTSEDRHRRILYRLSAPRR